MLPHWLDWAQRIQSIAQAGLAFSKDPFDLERYRSLRVIAAEILSNHSRIDYTVLHDLLCEQHGYPTPKVGVRGAAFQEEAILMVKDRKQGAWTLPGGFVDINESPGEAVVREIREETGFTTKAVKLLHLYDPQKHNHPPRLFHIYHLYFLCEIVGGEATNSLETEEVRFFREEEINHIHLWVVTSDQVRDVFDHYRNPIRPTSFD